MATVETIYLSMCARLATVPSVRWLWRCVTIRDARRGAFLVRSATGQFVRWDHAVRRGYSNSGLRHLAKRTGVTDPTALYVVLAAGYTADSANLLPLAPLLLVAWADGTVSDRERAVILDAARARHVEPLSRADGRLRGWMADCPEPPFWHTSLHALGAVLGALPPAVRADRTQHLLASCQAVASASRDGFGFGRTGAHLRCGGEGRGGSVNLGSPLNQCFLSSWLCR